MRMQQSRYELETSVPNHLYPSPSTISTTEEQQCLTLNRPKTPLNRSVVIKTTDVSETDNTDRVSEKDDSESGNDDVVPDVDPDILRRMQATKEIASLTDKGLLEMDKIISAEKVKRKLRHNLDNTSTGRRLDGIDRTLKQLLNSINLVNVPVWNSEDPTTLGVPPADCPHDLLTDFVTQSAIRSSLNNITGDQLHLYFSLLNDGKDVEAWRFLDRYVRDYISTKAPLDDRNAMITQYSASEVNKLINAVQDRFKIDFTAIRKDEGAAGLMRAIAQNTNVYIKDNNDLLQRLKKALNEKFPIYGSNTTVPVPDKRPDIVPITIPVSRVAKRPRIDLL